MVPEDRRDHGRHDSTSELLLYIAQLSHKHSVVLLNFRMGARLDLAHLVNTLYERTLAKVKSKHIAHARIKILAEADVGITLIISLRYHICNKDGAVLRAAMALCAKPPGAFRTPDAVTAPMGYRDYGRYKKCHLVRRHRRTAQRFLALQR